MLPEETPLRLCLAGAFLLTIHAVAPAAAQTTKNLVVNGSFDTSLSGWEVISTPFTTNTWRPADATGGPGSGTARTVLAAGHENGAIAFRQCITVNTPGRYALSMRTRVTAPRDYQVVAVVQPNSGAHCDGSVLSGQINFNAFPTTAWVTQHFTLTAPPGINSYAVYLDVQGGPGASANTVDFDDVFLGPLPEPPFACVDGPTTLCLDDAPGDKRFQVEARFAVHAPPNGDAHAVNMSSLGVSRGGLFWFFSPDNPELLVKVLNGCTLNQRFWVFASAGTNVAADVFVIDTHFSSVSWLHNPDGRAFPTIQDVGALRCTP